MECDQPEENTGRLALGRHFLAHLSLAVSSDSSPPQHPLDTRGMPPASSWREDLALVQRLGQLAGARESSGPEVLDRRQHVHGSPLGVREMSGSRLKSRSAMRGEIIELTQQDSVRKHPPGT